MLRFSISQRTRVHRSFRILHRKRANVRLVATSAGENERSHIARTCLSQTSKQVVRSSVPFLSCPSWLPRFLNRSNPTCFVASSLFSFWPLAVCLAEQQKPFQPDACDLPSQPSENCSRERFHLIHRSPSGRFRITIRSVSSFALFIKGINTSKKSQVRAISVWISSLENS